MPGRGLAQDIQREPIRIAYDASPGCPDAVAFAARVKTRSSRVRFAEPGESARTFAVTLVDGSPATGELNIVDGGHVDSPRSVHAETCADAADAMALIVTLAANPIRKTVPVPSTSMEDARERSRPLPRGSPPEAAPRPPEVVRPEPRPERAPSPGVSYAGADFILTGGVTPDALVGGSPYFGWRARDEGPIAPEFRVAIVRSIGSVGATVGGTVSFEWTAGRLDGCPLAWRPLTLRLTACARIEAGAVRVDASGIQDPRAPVTGWFAAGPVVRAQRIVIDALFADVELGALVRATNDRFVVLPTSTVYEVPLVGFSAGAGLGALFP
jgi:hypothetical protein